MKIADNAASWGEGKCILRARGHSVQGMEGTDIKRTGVLPEGTPHCAGENPPDAKQHYFHGTVETGKRMQVVTEISKEVLYDTK